VTVSLDVGPSPLVAGSSVVLHYTIIDATGAYRGDTGSGTAVLRESSAGGALTFTLTFGLLPPTNG
jgi:hypothetical protein